MYSTLTRNLTHNWHGIDELFKEFERHLTPFRARTSECQIRRTDDNNSTITLALPGVDPKDIEVQINDSIVTITAEAPQADVDGKTLLDEFTRTQTRRSYRLAFRPDPKKVKATSKAGILTLELERAASDKPKKVKVLAA